MIDVKHLSKSFGEVEVLKDINETIEKGEKVVIVGPSGSGKSTFLRCLNLMEKPTSGDIFFEGENITQANEHEMNKPDREWAWFFSISTSSRILQ